MTLSDAQRRAVRPFLKGKDVYDLGAGSDLVYVADLLAFGAATVVAVDKERMAKPVSTKIRCEQRRFDEYPKFPEDGDVAFVSWPVNRSNPGLIRMLQTAPIIVYVGKNTDGTACGDRDLFELFARRELITYVPDRQNVLAVYGEIRPTPRPKLTGEEFAVLEHTDMLSYTMAELLSIESRLRGLVAEARTKRFGENDNESLQAYLSCEAFESRMDPKRSEAFKLASNIVGAVLRSFEPAD